MKIRNKVIRSVMESPKLNSKKHIMCSVSHISKSEMDSATGQYLWQFYSASTRYFSWQHREKTANSYKMAAVVGAKLNGVCFIVLWSRPRRSVCRRCLSSWKDPVNGGDGLFNGRFISETLATIEPQFVDSRYAINKGEWIGFMSWPNERVFMVRFVRCLGIVWV